MSYTPGPLPEPACWTLKETLAAERTTTTGYLWFTNPVNYGWAELYTAEQLSAHTAAEVARAVAEERERFRKEYETELARLRLQSNAAVGFKPNNGPGPWFTWW